LCSWFAGLRLSCSPVSLASISGCGSSSLAS
jgi:hypothetical protein